MVVVGVGVVVGGGVGVGGSDSGQSALTAEMTR